MPSVQNIDTNHYQESSSYADRRKLFKHIWETAMNIDEKEDILNKPKVIKTLRLDEVDTCIVGKTKKQRIKNLRHVCKKILDFCDKQEADDTLHDLMVAEGQVAASGSSQDKHNFKIKEIKKYRRKKRVFKKTKSMSLPPEQVAQVKTTVSFGKDDENKMGKILQPPLLDAIKLTKVAESSKANASSNDSEAINNTMIGDTMASNFPSRRRKVVKKRKKKTSTSNVLPTGPKIQQIFGRASPTKTSQIK